MKAYTVAVGNINPLMRASRKAVKFIAKLDGLIGVHPHYPDGTLILFRTENDAKIGKNRMEAVGIHTGHNICECEIDDKFGRGETNDEKS